MSEEIVTTRDRGPVTPARGRRWEWWHFAVAMAGLLVVTLVIRSGVAHVLLLGFGGLLFGVILRLLTRGLRRLTGLPYRVALLVVFVGLIGLAVLAAWLAAGRLGAEAGRFAVEAPRALGQVRHRLQAYPWGPAVLDALTHAGRRMASEGTGDLTGLASSAVEAAVAVVAIAFVGLYIAWEPDLYLAGLLRLFPRQRQQRLESVARAVGYSLEWWLIGQSVTMVVLGLMTGLGLWLIGIPLALLMALVSMALSFIPTFGALLAYLPALLLAVPGGPSKMTYVTLLWVANHVVEGYILTPLVQRHAVWLPPALGILAQLALGALLGAVGLIFAYPLTIALMVIVKMLYVQDELGQRAAVPGMRDVPVPR